MEHVTHLECTICGREYDPTERIYTCPEHDGVEGILEVHYDYERIRERFTEPLDGRIDSQWKYRAFLPVGDDVEPVTLDEGGTSLHDAPTLSEELGLEVRIKDDGRNPTGVLKDRATSVSVTKAVAAPDTSTVTCASTGNAAASLAGYAARSGLDCRIFVPGDAPTEKLAQPLVYGADVLAVEGTYDEAYSLCMEATDRYGWYNRNAAINPFQVEGKRTVGHELAEQTQGDVPDWIAVSMGDGCTIYGAWKGFREFAELGYVEETPKMLGVQAEGASAIHDAFHEHDSIDDVADTIADSIAVGRPRNTLKACKALAQSDGTSVLAGDDAMLDAERLLAQTEGVYAEPAAAAPLAGVKRAQSEGIIQPDDTVVLLVTGSGLKDAKSAMEAGGDPIHIDPEFADVHALYE